MPKHAIGHTLFKGAVGIVLGLSLSVLPDIFFLLLGIILLVVFVVRVCRFGWRRDAMTALAVGVTVAVCALLPLKQLDVKVGPIAYDEMSLSDLCDRLRADYDVKCLVLGETRRTQRLSFSISEPLSRRQVLEKLSRETNRPLNFRYCGTNATVLFRGPLWHVLRGTEERCYRAATSCDRTEGAITPGIENTGNGCRRRLQTPIAAPESSESATGVASYSPNSPGCPRASQRPTRQECRLPWPAMGSLQPPVKEGQSDLRVRLSRHQREGRSVRLVVVEQREIPPRAVLLLQAQQDVGQMVLKGRPLLRGKLLDAQAPRNSGRSKRSSRPPGTTTRAGWAASGRCRARGSAQRADRARSSAPRRSPACRPRAASPGCRPASGPGCRRAG